MYNAAKICINILKVKVQVKKKLSFFLPRHKKDREAESLTQHQTTTFIRKQYLLSCRLYMHQVSKTNGSKLHLVL